MTRAFRLLALVALCACDAQTPSEVDTHDAAVEREAAAPGVIHQDASATTDAAPDAGPPLSVLFIGNSFTYFNDLPTRVRELAPRISVESEVAGGASFASHWGGATAKPAIAKGGRTHVVLQAQSYEPIGNEASFAKYGTLLIDAVKAAGAKPVLFETWAYRDGNPDAMQDQLTAAYEKLGKDTSVRVAPVGEAWRLARKQHPEITLFHADGVHPAAPGTYLSACVLTMVITESQLAPAATPPPDVTPQEAEVLRTIAKAAVAP